MIDALYISASGLRSEQKQIDIISNNVANMHTPGFKRSRVNFVEVASAVISQQPGDTSESTGNGTRVLSTSTIFSAGGLRPTQNPYDIAIEGAGFFEFEAENGDLVYSRDGRLRTDADGYLVNVQGLRLSAHIQVPADAIDLRIAPNGEITAKLSGSEERSVIGQIELVAFPAEDALTMLGDNQFGAVETAGAPNYGRPGDTGFGTVRQGHLELANVEMTEEMTSLVLAQRAYQLNARVLQASDQILETINNLRR